MSTRNGGRTWKDTSLNWDRLYNIHFISDSIGFIAGNSNALYKTTDGGESWSKINLQSLGFGINITKMKFADSKVGIGIGHYGMVIRTTDGGNTWTMLSNTIGSGILLYDLHFIDAQNVIIVGHQDGGGGRMYKSTDGGLRWTMQSNFFATGYSSFYAIGSDPTGKRLMVVGGGGYDPLGHNGRYILSSSDKGATWDTKSQNGRIDYRDVYFHDDAAGYIVGGGRIFKTEDYGESWREHPFGNTPFMYNTEYISFADAQHGFIKANHLFRTEDAGKTWKDMGRPEGVDVYGHFKMHFTSPTTGYIGSMYGVWQTSNGGADWRKVADPTVASFFKDYAVTKSGKGFAVGYAGKAFSNINGGDTWAAYALGTNEYLTSVYFMDEKLGFIGTSDSTLFKTTDGGQSWTKINTGLRYAEMRSFLFSSPDTGFLLTNNNGGLSNFYRTVDGGLHWQFLYQAHENVNKLVGYKGVYCVGERGMILKLDTVAAPSRPGYITGREKVCVLFESAYTTPEIAGVKYNWTINGFGVAKGEGHQKALTWTAMGVHTLSLTVENNCGVSPAQVLEVEAVDFKSLITPDDSLLTVTEGLGYQWFFNGKPIPASRGGLQRTLVATEEGTYKASVKSFYGCTDTTDLLHYIKTVPFDLKRFILERNGSGGVKIEWSTAYEKGIESMVLQKSSNNRQFQDLDSLAPKNVYHLTHTYTLEDLQPYRGINYYRLHIKIKGKPGVYSPVLDIRGSDEEQPIAYPNPVSGSLKIAKGKEAIRKVYLFDSYGIQHLAYINIEAANPVVLDIGNLKTGIYLIQIFTENAVYKERILVRN